MCVRLEVHACAHACRGPKCLPPSIEARSLAEPRVRHFHSSGIASMHEGFCLCFLCAGITGGLPYTPRYYMGFEELNSGPSVYMAMGLSDKQQTFPPESYKWLTKLPHLGS